MAWPLTPFIDFIADNTPPITAEFLNAIQAVINAQQALLNTITPAVPVAWATIGAAGAVIAGLNLAGSPTAAGGGKYVLAFNVGAITTYAVQLTPAQVTGVQSTCQWDPSNTTLAAGVLTVTVYTWASGSMSNTSFSITINGQ